ncbi:MAG: hypothetical protein JNK76_04480 [Planctomycetales bacterium]|nr:hypothetical protein [Planctomycetales bacterium]MBN8628408.1 hypothetical protein [Planctomycetota bacterium]
MNFNDANTNEAFPTDPSDPTSTPAAPAVIVEADDYEAFGLWMNVQLSQLVARWKHLASPAAAAGSSLEGRNSRKFDKPRKAK